MPGPVKREPELPGVVIDDQQRIQMNQRTHCGRLNSLVFGRNCTDRDDSTFVPKSNPSQRSSRKLGVHSSARHRTGIVLVQMLPLVRAGSTGPSLLVDGVAHTLVNLVRRPAGDTCGVVGCLCVIENLPVGPLQQQQCWAGYI